MGQGRGESYEDIIGTDVYRGKNICFSSIKCLIYSSTNQMYEYYINLCVHINKTVNIIINEQ